MINLIDLEISSELPDKLDVAAIMRSVGTLNGMGTELSLPEGKINLSFINDKEMQAMNYTYSGNDYTTDVLSFSYLESGGAIDGVIGEMVISAETALKQAEAQSISFDDEVSILCIHGILHIVGFDHQDKDGKDNMQNIQRRIAELSYVQYKDFEWKD